MSNTFTLEFVEQRLRGQDDVQCCLRVIEDQELTVDCLYPMGANWEDAVAEHPDASSLACLIASTNKLNALQLGELGRVSIKGAEGLYSEEEMLKLNQFLGARRAPHQHDLLTTSSVARHTW